MEIFVVWVMGSLSLGRGFVEFFATGFEEVAEFAQGPGFELYDAGFGDAHFVADLGEREGGFGLIEAVVMG